MSLTTEQWLTCIGLGLVMPVVAEVKEWVVRRGRAEPTTLEPTVAVEPERVRLA